jgi:beta-lactam-binding protein with PASTA domain
MLAIQKKEAERRAAMEARQKALAEQRAAMEARQKALAERQAQLQAQREAALAAQKAKQRTVPDVLGKTPEEAAEALKAVDLVPVPSGHHWSRNYRRDLVASQQPAAGKTVLKGSQVSLVLSSGAPARVPSVIGLNLAQATKLLANSKLTVGKVSYNGQVAAIKKVLSQDPAPNTEVEQMSQVNITVKGRGR